MRKLKVKQKTKSKSILGGIQTIMKHKFSSMGRVAIALVLALSLCLVMGVPVSAAYGITTVTPTDITVGPTYTPLTGPAIVEGLAADVGAGTIILTAPAGFAFDTGSVVTATVTGDGTPLLLSGGASSEIATVTTGTITITVTAVSVTEPSTITYTGIRIKDSNNTSGDTGNLAFSGDAGVTGNAGTLTSVPDVIDHFALVTGGTGTEVAGTAFTITVTAQDEFYNTVTSYTGAAVSVAFTTTATAAPDTTSPTIPTPQTLDFNTTPGIATATAFILVNAAETPTITADDGTYSGTSAAITVGPEVLAAYTVVPATLTPTAGVAFDVVITAVDEYENPLTTYIEPTAGDYIWTTTASDTWDISAPLLFVDFGAGAVATKSVTLDFIEAGVTFTVTDTDTITGISAGVAVVAGLADYLAVTGTETMTAGGTNELTVTAYDSADNVATSYTGSKTLVFSGPAVADDATAPTVEGVTMENETTVTFTAGVSSGTNATLIAYMAETKEVEVSDGTINSTGDAAYDLDLTVDPAAVAQLAYTVEPETVVAGVETDVFTVQRQDQYANPVTSGATIVGLASDSTGAAKVFRAISAGDAVTEVTIADEASTVDFYYDDEKAGAWTITASSGVLTSAESALTVGPAAIDHYTVSAITSPQVIGAAFPVTIQAQDVFNNDITTGTEEDVNIAVTAGGTVDPTTTGTTVAGAATVNVSLSAITLGQSITFAGVTSSKTGTSNPFQTVTYGAIDHYEIAVAVGPQVFDTQFTVIIQAKDAAGNDITLGADAIEDILVTCNLVDANLQVDGATDVTATGTASVKITLATAQAGQTIIFEGATSGATGTTSVFSVYDVIMDLPDVWVLFSTDIWINATDSAWIDTPVQFLKYVPGSGFLSATLADSKPVEALYVKMGSGGGDLGIIFLTGTPEVSAKELVAGWNLISSASSELNNAPDVLSGLHDVANAGTGLTTVVSQGIYNRTSPDFYVDATVWGNLSEYTLEPFDGYWIRMNADKTFGVVVVPGGPV